MDGNFTYKYRRRGIDARPSGNFPAGVDANPLRYRCVYPTYSDNEAGPKQAKGFSLEFALDTVSVKAVMIGNNGVEKYLLIKGLTD